MRRTTARHFSEEGVGVEPDLERWAIRPAVGILRNPGEDGSYYHFSVGVSFRP